MTAAARFHLPWFSIPASYLIQVLLLLNYFISFYVIFHHIYQNLLALQEQLSFIMEEDVQAMHDAILTKYKMFKYAITLYTLIYMSYLDAKSCFWCATFIYITQKIPGNNANCCHGRNYGMIRYGILSLNPFYMLYMDQSSLLRLLFGFQIFLNMDDSVEIYWLRLLVREWALFCIFCYIGYVYVYVYDHTFMRIA